MLLEKPVKFNPLDYPICLEMPRRLTDIDFWHEHIPFAFTLIQMLEPRVFVELGTHKGDSYCAFCQAVAELQTQTRCFAVDSWEGDEHVGHYEQSIYDELKAYHDPLYGSFSTLVKSLFDDALVNFADKSIDLLHIDGLHTYDAVKHDFETWLPKMSDRGVVLFHDTNVREESFAERGYEVWRFFEELSRRYPSFEFKFGNGLGIVAVGGEVPEPLLPLLGEDKAQADLIGKIYAALGSNIHQIEKTRREQKERANLQQYLGGVVKDRDAIREYLSGVEEDRKNLREYLGSVEEDRKNLREYLNGVEEDRKNLREYNNVLAQDRKEMLEYAGKVEQQYQTVLAQYNETVASIENSKANSKATKLREVAASQVGNLRGLLKKKK